MQIDERTIGDVVVLDIKGRVQLGDGDEMLKDKVNSLLNQGRKNYFSIIEGFAGRYGTLLDRDYYVLRKGAGQSDTSYQIAPLDPIQTPVGAVPFPAVGFHRFFRTARLCGRF